MGRGTDSLTLDFCACRKALQLLRELIRQRPEDIREGVQEGLLRTLMAAVKRDQPDVREAALALLALLVQSPGLVTVAKQVSCICALGQGHEKASKKGHTCRCIIATPLTMLCNWCCRIWTHTDLTAAACK